MAVARINWPTVAGGQRAIPAVLVAGFPYLIVPAGVSVASVTWSDSADAAWHVGTSPSVKAWLDTSSEAPPLVISEEAHPVQGTIEVGDLAFHLLDVDGAATRLLYSRMTPYALLAASLAASGTTITVDAPDLFPSSGTVHLGRERITYSGKSGSTLTGCSRGTAGTRASIYVAAERHRVYAQPSGVDVLPSVLDRRVTLWMLKITDAGAVTDPTLVYDGRGTIGGGLTRSGAAIELVTRHVSKVLAEKAAAPSVLAFGYQHHLDRASSRGNSIVGESGSYENPLQVFWMPSGSGGTVVMLGNDAGEPDSDGFHPTKESFLASFNAACAALSSTIRAALGPDGRLYVGASASPDRRLTGRIPWTYPQPFHADPPDPGDTAARAQLGRDTNPPMPQACLWLNGTVTFRPSDIAQIPAVPSNPLTDDVDAFWTLTCDRDNGLPGYPKARITARITAVGASTLTLGTHVDPRLGPWGYLLTKPTVCALGLEAQGARWWTTLRYGIFQRLDVLRGLDWLEDSIAWDRIAAMAQANPGIGSTARQYLIDPREPLIEHLKTEARLSGMALVTYRGRVSFAAFRETSPSDPKVATIEADDLRAGAAPSIQTTGDGLLTSIVLTLPESGDRVRVVDGGAVKESGQGEEIEVTAPRGCLPEGVLGDRFFETFTALAMGVISPWSRPYEVATLPVTLAFGHVEIGDVIGVREWLLPNADGTRGLELPDVPGAAIPGVVFGRKLDLTTGAVDLLVRVHGTAYGYAPEALVSSISAAVLTLDTSTLGAAGFAPPYNADGTARTDAGASFFTAGDKVQLIEIDATSPATPFDGEVASTSGATVTLTASPGATWETIAAAGRCLLVFARWDTVVSSQKAWAFVADDATVALSDGTAARRYV